MSNEEHWFYYADALPEYAHKLVRIGDGQAQRYTARNGWVTRTALSPRSNGPATGTRSGMTTLTPSSRTSTTRNPVSRTRFGSRRGN